MLKQVRVGMRVYDSNQGDIGRVDRVYLAPPSDPGNAWDNESATRLFEPDNLSEELRERLQRHGFLRVSASGIHSAGRYIEPDLVDRIQKNRVILKVARRDLST